MTHDERLQLLQTWHEKGEALEKSSDDLCTMFDVGSLDRTPILAAAWNLWDAYTQIVAAAVGDTRLDQRVYGYRSTLDWWWDVNHSRSSLEPYKAKAATWDEARPIRTLADLCGLIEADLRK